MKVKWSVMLLDSQRVLYGNAMDRELDCVIVKDYNKQYNLYLNVTKGLLLDKTQVSFVVPKGSNVKVEAHKILEKLV